MFSTRIAILGLGNIGQVHLVNLTGLRGCMVVAVYDPRHDGKHTAGAGAGVRVAADAASVFADPEVDAVVIATPSETHRDLVERALAAGKHVFVEKPLAGTLEDARAIVAMVARHPGKIVQTGFCERFDPPFVEAKRAIAAGTLGRPRHIRSERTAPRALGNPAWELGVLDTAVHNFDLILWLMGEMPDRVMAHGARLYPDSLIIDCVTTLLAFPSGALATDSIAWLDDAAHPLSQCARARMSVFGETGTFEADLTSRPSALMTKSAYRAIDTVLLGGPGYQGCLAAQFEGFLASIQLGAPVRAQVEDAYRAEAVALAAQRSLSSGNWEVPA